MNTKRTLWSCYALLVALAIPASVALTFAEDAESKDEKIARAMRAAAPAISQDATIIDEEQAHKATKVQIGSTVTVSAGKDTDPQEFHIVGSAEAAPTEGRISNESPVGQALLSKRVGDEVQVAVPKGVLRYTITKIS